MPSPGPRICTASLVHCATIGLNRVSSIWQVLAKKALWSKNLLLTTHLGDFIYVNVTILYTVYNMYTCFVLHPASTCTMTHLAGSFKLTWPTAWPWRFCDMLKARSSTACTLYGGAIVNFNDCEKNASQRYYLHWARTSPWMDQWTIWPCGAPLAQLSQALQELPHKSSSQLTRTHPLRLQQFTSKKHGWFWETQQQRLIKCGTASKARLISPP